MSNAKVNNIKDISEWKGVLVVAEQRYGKILNVAYELIGEGKKIAEKLGTTLEVIVLGNSIDEEIDKLKHYGMDKVVYFDHTLLKDYTTDAYTKVISEYILEKKPETVLIGATTVGRDLAPRLAGRLGTGLTADCTVLDVDLEDKKMLQTRPAFGGNLMATIVCPKNRPQMSTIRPGVMEKAKYEEISSLVEKRDPSIKESDILAKIIEIVKEEREIAKLDEAEIIVAGGRGIGTKENYELIKSLAKALGGTYGASRAIVDNGWVTADRQIGQTGTTVRPKLYIACGISGAIQHLAGMSESDIIVAINKNPDAPIFKIATYGIVGDLTKVIPEILALI